MTEAEKKAFNRGYLIACCNLVNMHREDTMAAEVLAEAGIPRSEVKAMGLSEYDMRAIREMVRGARDYPFVRN